MATKRNFLNIAFIATLAASAGYAAFSPTTASAKLHTSDQEFKCEDIGKNGSKLSPASKAALKDACTKAGVKTYGDMGKKVMKPWLDKAKTKMDGLKCGSCHNDGSGLDGTKDDGYSKFDDFVKNSK
ncbi:MAG TPA: hypothetical protein VHM70_20585 [Polyangiaceae bacterium]|jgi:hypothetical protein|nr:hypothetical protein [Polyangiaceae bacterium]